MDYVAAKFWMDVAMIVINLGLWVFIWNTNKNRVTKAELDKHAVELGRMDERLKNAIGHSELGPIFDRLNDMNNRLSEMGGKMHTLDLIHEYLINGGKS